MRHLIFANLHCLLYLNIFTQAASIPSAVVLEPSVQSSPFNISLPDNVNPNASLRAPPNVPFHYQIPNTNMALKFTSFDVLLPSISVLSAFIDATLFAVDGLANHPRRPAPYGRGRPLLWKEGSAELSITPINSINYIALANTIAGLEAVDLAFGSQRNGMYAARFDIYVATLKIGSGQLANKPPRPSLGSPVPSKPNNTATARRALTDLGDPVRFHVDDTPISLWLSPYHAFLPLSKVLYLLLQSMLTAAGVIRDSGIDVFIGGRWGWDHAGLQLTLDPKEDMSWRNMATAAKGMKDWVVRDGAKDFQFRVDMDRVGNLGSGGLRRV